MDEPAGIDPWRSPWPDDDKRPLVMVGFSTTYQAHEGVLQKIVDAAAGMPVRVLVTLGQVAPESVRPAANTVITANSPHDVLMRQAALVVTHVGHGTLMRALSHGLSLLVIPHGRDQDKNAVRFVEHGAGLRLNAASGTDDIRAALQRLLSERSFTGSAQRLGAAVAKESTQVDVAAELEALAAHPACHACDA